MKNFLFLTIIFFPFFASSQLETEMELKNENCLLKGTLTIPEMQDASTLIILIAGSGPTDRDGNNPQMKNNSLKFLSDELVKAGYACFSYDKRGIAESKIEYFDQKDIRFDQFISDASAWVNEFKLNGGFDKIVLAGHSQGSLVAMAAANQNDNVHAVISISGAGQRIHQILKKQLSVSLSIEMQGIVDAKMDTLARGDTLMDPMAPGYVSGLFHPALQQFMISWMKYDPVIEIAKLKVPIFITNGTTDLQVPPTEAKLLSKNNPTAKLVIIKNMNHVLKFTKDVEMGPQLEIYADAEMHLHKKLVPAIAKFLETL